MKKDFKNVLISPSDFTNSPIQLGDKVESIDLSEIELIRVMHYPFPTTNDNNRILRKLETGEEIEITFEEKYKLMSEGKGAWVNLKNKQIWLVIDSESKVESIKIENFQKNIGLEKISRKKVVQIFGEPEELERDMMSYMMFYFERSFQISIPYESSNILPSITFGKLLHDKTWLTAKDLLESYLEFETVPRGIVKNLMEYNLKALFEAFGLYREIRIHNRKSYEPKNKNKGFLSLFRSKSKPREFHKEKRNVFSLKYFESGDFIFNYKLEQYSSLVERLTEFNAKWNRSYDIDEIELDDFEDVFTDFLEYRISVQQLFKHHSGVLEASMLSAQYKLELVGEVNNKLSESIQEIDNILCETIDPLNQKFSIAELEKDFGYLNTDIIYISTCWAWDGEYPKDMVKR
jgi:hypothetical protein